MEYFFLLSSEIDDYVRLKIDSLITPPSEKSLLPSPSPYDTLTEFLQIDVSGVYLTVQLFSEDKPILPAYRTPFRSFSSELERNWSLWCTFPVRYRDIPRDTTVVISVFDLSRSETRPVGCTLLPLFSHNGILHVGRQKLRIFLEEEPDLCLPSSTDGMPSNSSAELSHEQEEARRIDKRMKKFETNSLPRNRWMDVLVLKKIASAANERKKKSTDVFLRIELQSFPHPVVFNEGPLVMTSVTSSDLIIVHDGDANKFEDNPIEVKYRKLSRIRSLPSSDLKPTSIELKDLMAIVDLPPTHILRGDEKDLVWKYRGFLSSYKRALTKFLKCVDFSDEKESSEAISLMKKWAHIDISDSLELLSNAFAGNEAVRSHAVSRLNAASNAELEDILLQLVQALHYDSSSESKLARFLIRRGLEARNLGIAFHWYLLVAAETRVDDDSDATRSVFSEVHSRFLAALAAGTDVLDGKDRLIELQRQNEFVASLSRMVMDLKLLNVSRSKKIEALRHHIETPGGKLHNLSTFTPLKLPLHPDVSVCGLLADKCSMFKSALSPLNLKFKTSAILAKDPKDVGGGGHDSDKFRKSSAQPESEHDLTATPLSLDQSTDSSNVSDSSSMIDGAVGGGAPSSPSSLSPKKSNTAGSSIERLIDVYGVVFKHGDDMRQDQLIIQMIRLMDRLLKKERLDLCLTPYRVLATSAKDGLSQFIPSKNLSHVLQENKGEIRKFLREPGEKDVQRDVVDHFVRSCAGYCVITYLLGIGDRHLDNLMLCRDGRLFHIDFGYILGKDPKPFPPPMKLCKEMVEAMGGYGSPDYHTFKTLACEAFNILRKSAHLILNLFVLMVDADIPDLKEEPEKCVLKVQERFRLDLGDEEAVQFFQELITESVKALFPQMFETIHRWAQYWRS